MNFIEKTLTNNEEVKSLFHLHPFKFVSSYLLMIISFIIAGTFFLIEPTFWLFLFAGSVIIFLTGLFQYFTLKSIHMGVTNRRVIYKRGLFSIYNEEIQIGAIETVEVNQSVLGRIFGFGDVRVTGKGKSIVLFETIKDPVNAKKAIGNLIS